MNYRFVDSVSMSILRRIPSGQTHPFLKVCNYFSSLIPKSYKFVWLFFFAPMTRTWNISTSCFHSQLYVYLMTRQYTGLGVIWYVLVLDFPQPLKRWLIGSNLKPTTLAKNSIRSTYVVYFKKDFSVGFQRVLSSFIRVQPEFNNIFANYKLNNLSGWYMQLSILTLVFI